MEDYLKTKGRIFDIQRYSIHDGNGIRTIVFLKGCVLHRRWCCNPESQSYEIETMMVQGEPKIIGEDTTVGEVMKTVEKDRTYYRRTGGGLTLSGGESLCQPEFARDMLRAAHEAGITTAMESMGCADYSVIEEILPYLDQYLLDIKHMNSKKHEEFIRGTAVELKTLCEKEELKGECCILIGSTRPEGVTTSIATEETASCEHLSLEEQVQWAMEHQQLSQKDAIKWVAKQNQLKKQDVYKLIHQE